MRVWTQWIIRVSIARCGLSSMLASPAEHGDAKQERMFPVCRLGALLVLPSMFDTPEQGTEGLPTPRMCHMSRVIPAVYIVYDLTLRVCYMRRDCTVMFAWI